MLTLQDLTLKIPDMGLNIKQRITISSAKFAGSVYFLLLGLINFVATVIFAEIRLFDSIIAVVCFLPFLINKKIFLLVFGIVAALISVYLTYAGLTFMVNPQVQTSKISFLMGFLLTGSAFISSMLLIFVGISDEKMKLSSV